MDGLLFLAVIAAFLGLALMASDAEPRDSVLDHSPRPQGAETMWQIHAHAALQLANDRIREHERAARRAAMLRDYEPVPRRGSREVRAAFAVPVRAVARVAGGAAAAASGIATRIEGRTPDPGLG